MILFQNLSLGIFLNLTTASFHSWGVIVSFIFSIIGLVFISAVILGFISIMNKYKESEGIVIEELKYLQDVKPDSWATVHFKTYKYLIKTVWLSFCVTVLNGIPKLASALISLGFLVEVIWALAARPYNSIVLNKKAFLEAFLMLYVSLCYISFSFIGGMESMSNILGISVIVVIGILLIMTVIFKIYKRNSL